jgi:sporulation protein YlmC with PRC-barrel domain
MALESWVVSNRAGEKLGLVRKLLLDPRTGQITHAEVALSPTETVIRVPWTALELGSDGLILDGTMDEIAAFYYFQKGTVTASNVC